MKSLIAFATVTILLLSCAGSADKKVPELADDMCGCFDKMQQSYSAEIITLLKEVSVAADPQTVLTAGMMKLKTEDAKKLAASLGEMGNKNSEVFKCMEAFDKKHEKETTTNRTELTERLLAQMQANGNCNAGAAIVNLGLSKQRKLAKN